MNINKIYTPTSHIQYSFIFIPITLSITHFTILFIHYDLHTYINIFTCTIVQNLFSISFSPIASLSNQIYYKPSFSYTNLFIYFLLVHIFIELPLPCFLCHSSSLRRKKLTRPSFSSHAPFHSFPNQLLTHSKENYIKYDVIQFLKEPKVRKTYTKLPTYMASI